MTDVEAVADHLTGRQRWVAFAVLLAQVEDIHVYVYAFTDTDHHMAKHWLGVDPEGVSLLLQHDVLQRGDAAGVPGLATTVPALMAARQDPVRVLLTP